MPCHNWSLPDGTHFSGLCSIEMLPETANPTKSCGLCATPILPAGNCLPNLACSGSGIRMPFYVNILLDEELLEPFPDGEISGVYYSTVEPTYTQTFDATFKSVSAAEISSRTRLTSLGYNPLLPDTQQNSCQWENRQRGRRWFLQELIAIVPYANMSLTVSDYLASVLGGLSPYPNCATAQGCGYQDFYGDWVLSLTQTTAVMSLLRKFAKHTHLRAVRLLSGDTTNHYSWLPNLSPAKFRAPGFTLTPGGFDSGVWNQTGSFLPGDLIGRWELTQPCRMRHRTEWRMNKTYDVHNEFPEFTISNLPDVLNVRIGVQLP
jgi:hypothetical protein